ncbi:MAG: hypothetical protein AAF664_12910 [Planctomycetota bacterium]
MRRYLVAPTTLFLFASFAFPFKTPAVESVSVGGSPDVRDASADDEEKASSTQDLWQAIKNPDFEVRYIPASAHRGNLLIENNTDQPATIQLPSVLVARPVLAQGGFPFGPGQAGPGNQNGGNGNGGGGGQTVGGNGGGGQQNGLFGGALMRVPPGKTAKRRITTVCLEHGKPDPEPSMAYEIVSIEEFTEDEVVIEACRELGHSLSTKAVQAIAWHRLDQLEWSELANKSTGTRPPFTMFRYFSHQSINTAKRWVGAREARGGSTFTQSDSLMRGYLER